MQIALAVVAVLALVLYRMSVLAALSVYGDNVITSYALLFTTATAASINLCLIVLFNMVSPIMRYLLVKFSQVNKFSKIYRIYCFY